eukprot:3795594-Rhodomonas_salina.4
MKNKFKLLVRSMLEHTCVLRRESAPCRRRPMSVHAPPALEADRSRVGRRIDSTASIYHVTSIRSDSDFGSMQPDPGLGLTPSIENLPGPTDPRFAAAACTHHSTQITHTSHKISTSKQLAQRCHHDVIRVVTRLTAAAAFGAKGRCGMSDPMPETEAVIACGGFCGRCAPSSPDLGPSFPLPAASPFAAIRTNVR